MDFDREIELHNLFIYTAFIGLGILPDICDLGIPRQIDQPLALISSWPPWGSDIL